MRKFEIKTWKEIVPKFDGEKRVGTEDVDWSLLKSLGILLQNKDPKDMPRGLDNFRLMGRLDKAFKKAEKTNMLELEEQDYKFLKDMIEKDIPSIWGQNPNILESIGEFVEVKSELSKEEEEKKPE